MGQEYQPPPGPPPGYRGPSGSNQGYAPPPGPPPGYKGPSASNEEYAPPAGPPPSKSKLPMNEDPPPYHDWQSAVPDTSLLPPPPALTQDFSPTANADYSDAQRAAAWCDVNPLWQAQALSSQQLHDVAQGNMQLLRQQPYVGDVSAVGPGRWHCRTTIECPDSLVQATLPLYSALADSPLYTERAKTIYFEVKVLGLGGKKKLFSRDAVDSGIALGFFAPPYPAFRLPGWQRGSLGVHGDDGRRYVNDPHGGIDFTDGFKKGETVGLGMRFRIPPAPPGYDGVGERLHVEVFFTRGGREVGSWDLHEQRDALDQGVQGLEGECDVFPAVGVFGACDFEVVFREADWLYRLQR